MIAESVEVDRFLPGNTAATNLGQRLLNEAGWLRHSTMARGLVIAIALALLLWPKVDFHRGTFNSDFNQDLDVDSVNLKVRGGFEFRLGGGSLNLVNTRWDWGVELVHAPR